MNEELGGQECFDKMLDGQLEEYKIMNNEVSKQVIMLVVHLNPTIDSKISDARIGIDTESNILLSEINEFEAELQLI